MAGVQRLVGLLVSLLIANLLGVLILNRAFPYTGERVKLKGNIPRGNGESQPDISSEGQSDEAAVVPSSLSTGGQPGTPQSTSALDAGAPPAPPAFDPAYARTVAFRPPSLWKPFLLLDPDAGTLFELESEQTTVGRAPDNTLRMDSAEISRYHALITRTPDRRLLLADLGSLNGTHVNETRLEGVVELQDKDCVRFGGPVEGVTVEVKLPEDP